VSLIRKGEFTEVTHVSIGPFSFTGIVKAVAKHEGIETLFGTGEVVTSIGARSADITNSLIERGRDANFGDITVAESFGDVRSVAFIGFDFLVRLALGL